MRKLLIAPVLVACLTVAGYAAAEENDATTAAPQADWMTVGQITDKFTAEGYNVRQVKVEGNGYEVYAVAKDGKRLEADVNPVTGEIVKSEADD